MAEGRQRGAQVLLKYRAGRSDKLKRLDEFQHADSSIVLIVSRLSLFFLVSSRVDRMLPAPRVLWPPWSSPPHGMVNGIFDGLECRSLWCVEAKRGSNKKKNGPSKLEIPLDYFHGIASHELGFLLLSAPCYTLNPNDTFLCKIVPSNLSKKLHF